MIRRNPYSLRTRMASQFGSRMSTSSFEENFQKLAKFLTGYSSSLSDDMDRILDGDDPYAPDLSSISLSYEQEFGRPLDIEKFMLTIDAQHQKAFLAIIKENLAKLKAGKV